MKTEQQVRNTPDNTDQKIMAILEYYLSLHEADEVFSAINNPEFEVSDVIELLSSFHK